MIGLLVTIFSGHVASSIFMPGATNTDLQLKLSACGRLQYVKNFFVYVHMWAPKQCCLSALV